MGLRRLLRQADGHLADLADRDIQVPRTVAVVRAGAVAHVRLVIQHRLEQRARLLVHHTLPLTAVTGIPIPIPPGAVNPSRSTYRPPQCAHPAPPSLLPLRSLNRSTGSSRLSGHKVQVIEFAVAGCTFPFTTLYSCLLMMYSSELLAVPPAGVSRWV